MSKLNIEAILILCAGLMGFIAVAAAAAARHLAGGDAQAVTLVDLASRYMLVHAAALLGVAMLAGQAPAGRGLLRAAGLLFVAGAVLFGGGMILWALTHMTGFEIAIPVGGTCLMLGWLALAVGGFIRLAGGRS